MGLGYCNLRHLLCRITKNAMTICRLKVLTNVMDFVDWMARLSTFCNSNSLQVASRNGSQANGGHGSVPPNVAIYLKNCWFTMKNSGNRSGLCTPTPTPTIPCAPSPFTKLAPGGAGSALLSPPPLQLPDVTLRFANNGRGVAFFTLGYGWFTHLHAGTSPWRLKRGQ